MVLRAQRKTNLNFFGNLAFIFSNSLIRNGNKIRASNIADKVFLYLRKRHGVHPYKIFFLLLNECRPKVHLYPKRIAGITYKIPVPVSKRKSFIVAVHWLLEAASKRKGRTLEAALIEELEQIYIKPINNVSKKRDEFHRLAYLNKPFLRFMRFLLLYA
jgi:ribosomal protein S7